MYGLVEWYCDCKCGGIIRVGRKSFAFSEDYEFGFPFKNLFTGFAEYKTFPLGGTWAHSVAAIEAVNREGLLAYWVKMQPQPHAMRQDRKALFAGKVVMRRVPLEGEQLRKWKQRSTSQ